MTGDPGQGLNRHVNRGRCGIHCQGTSVHSLATGQVVTLMLESINHDQTFVIVFSRHNECSPCSSARLGRV